MTADETLTMPEAIAHALLTGDMIRPVTWHNTGKAVRLEGTGVYATITPYSRREGIYKQYSLAEIPTAMELMGTWVSVPQCIVDSEYPA